MPWTELCPAIGDLTAMKMDPPVLEHVRGCPRCATLVHELAGHIGAPERSEASANSRTIAGADARDPAVGEVYALRSPHRDEFELALVVGLEDRDVAVLAICEGYGPACGGDVALTESALGFDAVVVPQLGGWVLPEQLDGRIGAIDVAQAQTLRIPDGRRTTMSAEIGNDDARLLELREVWDPYLEPARSLRKTDTLGELLALRQSYLRVSSTRLAEAADLAERDVEALRNDRLDLLKISPQKLASVLRSLYVLFSEKLAERITLSLVVTGDAQTGVSMTHRVGRERAESQQRSTHERYLAQVRDYLP